MMLSMRLDSGGQNGVTRPGAVPVLSIPSCVFPANHKLAGDLASSIKPTVEELVDPNDPLLKPQCFNGFWFILTPSRRIKEIAPGHYAPLFRSAVLLNGKAVRVKVNGFKEWIGRRRTIRKTKVFIAAKFSA